MIWYPISVFIYPWIIKKCTINLELKTCLHIVISTYQYSSAWLEMLYDCSALKFN